MATANQELRQLMREKRIPIWLLAAEIGVCENTLVRHFRFELTDSKKKEYFGIVNRLASQRKEDCTGEME